MTFEEATALQPAWVGIWLNILLFGAFILPVALLFWKESRITGFVTLVSSALSAAGVIWIFSEGLPAGAGSIILRNVIPDTA